MRHVNRPSMSSGLESQKAIVSSSQSCATSPARQPRCLESIPVFVVEDHHEVVPLFFSLVRSKRIALGTATMLHLDSHPDLSVPSTGEGPASWARLQSLFYDTLEASEGGIAEWLVPLLYNGLLKKVLWLRNREQCTQLSDKLPEGKEATFFCGAPLDPEGGVSAAVTLDSAYYREDRTFLPLELLNPETVRPLTVQLDALPATGDDDDASRLAAAVLAQGGKEWVLDVCLDFFACSNPFLVDVQRCLAQDLARPGNAAEQEPGPGPGPGPGPEPEPGPGPGPAGGA